MLGLQVQALGNKVFAHGGRDQLDRLNAIVWPYIKREIERELTNLKTKGVTPVFVEAAVLVEANWDVLFDEVWVVYTPSNIAVERLKATRNLSGMLCHFDSMPKMWKKKENKLPIVFEFRGGSTEPDQQTDYQRRTFQHRFRKTLQ